MGFSPRGIRDNGLAVLLGFFCCTLREFVVSLFYSKQ
jgi:hypothetical protein